MKISTRIVTILTFISVLTICSSLHASSMRDTCKQIVSKHALESKLSTTYKEFANYFNSIGVNIDDLTKYRATRLINNSFWNKKNRKDMALVWEIYDPKPFVWINWERGALFVDNNFEDIVENLDEKLIRELYLNAMDKTIMSKSARRKAGAFFGDGTFGTIRSGDTETPAWTAKCDKSPLPTDEVKALLNFDFSFKSYSQTEPLVSVVLSRGQLKKYIEFSKGRELSNKQKKRLVLQVTECKKKKGFHKIRVEYLASSKIRKAMQQFLSYYHKTFKEMCLGQNTISPIEFAAKVQRWFVSLHPFSDGNGRTSRFIQDALMKYFELPYLNAGKLQSDVTTEENKYASLSKYVMQEQISFFSICSKQYKKQSRIGAQVENNCLPAINSSFDNNEERVRAKRNFKKLLEESI